MMALVGTVVNHVNKSMKLSIFTVSPYYYADMVMSQMHYIDVEDTRSASSVTHRLNCRVPKILSCGTRNKHC